MIEILKTILIGIVQGITEWLPVSSTGHMILFNEFIPLGVSEEFWNMFLVVIQLGSIMAVVLLYFRRLNPFAPSKSVAEKHDVWSLWFKVILAVIPAAVAGFFLDDLFDKYAKSYLVVATALIVYGLIFIVVEKYGAKKSRGTEHVSMITYRTAFLIGVFQVLAIVPGTSRSGATIIGAMLLGLSRTAAAEFSFFMAIPTMFGASALKIAKFALKDGYTMDANEWLILFVGCAVAFAVSVAAIKFLMDFVRRHTFVSFGVYRIVLGVAVIACFTIFS